MSSACDNACERPPDFPRRHVNRPGLERIDYRIGAYAEVRELLLHRLDLDRVLSGWTHRGADDPGIALLECAAILGDILTFYQELYANETFLRTAGWRDSVADLVRLLGYRLAPGLGGTGTFVFEAKGNKPIAIPAGFPLKVELSGAGKPVDLETKAAITAYPWLSRFQLYRPLQQPKLAAATRAFYLEAPTTGAPKLEAGDRLLVGTPDSFSAPVRLDEAELWVVDEVTQLHGVKHYKIKGRPRRNFGKETLAAFKLGRSFRHFGHNSPLERVQPTSSGASLKKVEFFRSLSGDTPDPGATYWSGYRGSGSGWGSGSGGYGYAGYSGTGWGGGYGYAGYSGGSATGWGTGYGSYGGYGYGYAAAGAAAASCVSGTWSAGYELRVEPQLGPDQFPLDNSADDLAAGGWFLVRAGVGGRGRQTRHTTLVRRIKAVQAASVTWGVVSGASTLVTLDADLSVSLGGTAYGCADIRKMQAHEVQGPLLRIKPAPQEPTAPASGTHLYFLGTPAQAATLANRRLMLVPAKGEPEIRKVLAVDATPRFAGPTSGLHRLILSGSVSYAEFPNRIGSGQQFPVTVHANLAPADQGKQEREAVLGNGDARASFQTFKLPKAPLTYHLNSGATPPYTPALEVRVDGRLFRRVSSLYGQAASAQIYIVREDPEGNGYVQFGDGKTGARLPSGVGNVKARYRSGSGAYGVKKQDTKIQTGRSLEGLKAVQLPGPLTGGEAPERADKARVAGPGKVKTLGRLVSLADFEAETLAIPGVSRACADWSLVDNAPAVIVTVLMDRGRQGELQSVEKSLKKANRCRGPGRYPIVVRCGCRRYLYLHAQVAIRPGRVQTQVLAAVRQALGVVGEEKGLFAAAQRRFGEPEYVSRVEAVIQGVAGVDWTRVTGFGALPLPAASSGCISDPSTLSLPAAPWPRSPKILCEADRILVLLHPYHLTLQPVSPPVAEDCPDER